MEETKLRFLHLWTNFYINTTFTLIFTYWILKQIPKNKNKGTKLHLSFMDRFLHIKSSNKYPKNKNYWERKWTQKNNEPKRRRRSHTTKSLSNPTITSSFVTKTSTTTRFVLLHEGEGGSVSEWEWGWVGEWIRVRVRMRCECLNLICEFESLNGVD